MQILSHGKCCLDFDKTNSVILKRSKVVESRRSCVLSMGHHSTPKQNWLLHVFKENLILMLNDTFISNWHLPMVSLVHGGSMCGFSIIQSLVSPSWADLLIQRVHYCLPASLKHSVFGSKFHANAGKRDTGWIVNFRSLKFYTHDRSPITFYSIFCPVLHWNGRLNVYFVHAQTPNVHEWVRETEWALIKRDFILFILYVERILISLRIIHGW